MSDRPSRELDELFQKGSELHDFEYNPEAWKDMEARLDKDRRRRFFWWFFGIGIICLFIALICYSNYRKEKVVSVSDTSIHKVDERNKSQKSSSQNNTEQSHLKEKQEAVGGSNNTLNGIEHELLNDDIDSSESQEEGIVVLPSVLDNQDNTEKEKPSSVRNDDINLNESQEEAIVVLPSVLDNQDNTEKEKPSSVKNDDIDSSESQKEGIVVLPSVIGNHDTNKQEGDSVEEELIKEESVESNTRKSRGNFDAPKLVSKIPTLAFTVLKSNQQLDHEKEHLSLFFEEQLDSLTRLKPKPKRDHMFLAGLLLAAESSSAGIDDFSKPNWKYGAFVEYRFRQKFGVSLGASLVNKKYDAGEGDYTPVKGFWVRTIAPKSTKADCKVLEIPLAASYYLKGYKKNGFYTSVGLVSYFMLTEQYNYFYDLPDPDLKRSWGTENSNKHWLGVGQLSFGYQYFVTPKIPVQIAPYLQIPISGVGHGNVKLWSAGLMLKMNLKVK